jgi:hypothetical protein
MCLPIVYQWTTNTLIIILFYYFIIFGTYDLRQAADLQYQNGFKKSRI